MPESLPQERLDVMPPIRTRTRVFEPCRVYVVGVLNATPDSFSDGGRYVELDAALARVEEMLAEGADIIDIGGESTRPRGRTYGAGAVVVDAGEERRRVVPIVDAVVKRFGASVSVDTSKAAVAKAALDVGAEWVNDITALTGDPAMADVVVRGGCPVVLMHMRGTPQTTEALGQYDDVVCDVRQELAARVGVAARAGIARDQIVIDPGLGFGKSAADNLRLLRDGRALLDVGRPMWWGPSRKRFIGEALGGAAVDARQWGNAAAVTAAVLQGATFVRVHDTGTMAQVARTALAIRRACTSEGGGDELAR